jgi:hypothetical protein
MYTAKKEDFSSNSINVKHELHLRNELISIEKENIDLKTIINQQQI